MSRITFTFLLLPYCFSSSFAQAPDTLWTKTYGGINDDVGYSVRQTADGGYIIIGWTESFGAGGRDVWLIKTDANGDTLWTKTYGDSVDEVGRSVQQTADSGYIIVGSTDYGIYVDDIWLIKTDINGDTIWTKIYGDIAMDYGYCVQQTSDGGYIISGTAFTPLTYSYDLYLIKTDSNGDTIWAKSYGVAEHIEYGLSVQQTTDSGYIVVGNKGEIEVDFNLFDIWLLKTDSSGDTLWTKIYGGVENDEGRSVQQLSSGGYIIAGFSSNFGSPDPVVWLLKTDSSGDTLWTKIYGGSGWDEGHSVQQTSDSGFIITGMTTSFGPGNGDVYLIKTDANGDTLWTATYGGTVSDGGYSVQQTADSGYIITGYTYSFGSGERDVYLIKTKSEVGIEEELSDRLSDVKIPSLVHGNLLKLTGIDKHTEIKIFDILGREVLTQKLSPKDTDIKLNDLCSGIYFLQIKTSTQSKTEKIIILK